MLNKQLATGTESGVMASACAFSFGYWNAIKRFNRFIADQYYELNQITTGDLRAASCCPQIKEKEATERLFVPLLPFALPSLLRAMLLITFCYSVFRRISMHL